MTPWVKNSSASTCAWPHGALLPKSLNTNLFGLWFVCVSAYTCALATQAGLQHFQSLLVFTFKTDSKI